MRRSQQVAAPLLASAALAMLSGCKQSEMRCVDSHNAVVDHSLCTPVSGGEYRLYYDGHLDSSGDFAVGGSNHPEEGKHNEFATERGGFGSTFGLGLIFGGSFLAIALGAGA